MFYKCYVTLVKNIKKSSSDPRFPTTGAPKNITYCCFLWSSLSILYLFWLGIVPWKRKLISGSSGLLDWYILVIFKNCKYGQLSKTTACMDPLNIISLFYDSFIKMAMYKWLQIICLTLTFVIVYKLNARPPPHYLLSC